MYDYKDKLTNIDILNKYMLVRTLSMFNYENLPDTIPCKELEKQLQTNGYSFITEFEGKLYAFNGSMGGKLSPYGEPLEININNPYLNFNANLNIENDGILIKNDDMKLGIYKLFERYNTLITENEITMFLNSYNERIQSLISAGDDNTKESAEKYIEKIINGDLGIIGENRLFEGITVQTTKNGASNNTTQLVEFNQYLKATLFNEVGLNANFNMKRERINSSEVDLNTENLHPLIDNMINNRLDSIKKLNEKYNLNVNVEYGSIWQSRNVEKQNIEDTIETPIQEQQEEVEPIEKHVEPKEEPIEEPIEITKEEPVEPVEEIEPKVEPKEEPKEEPVETKEEDVEIKEVPKEEDVEEDSKKDKEVKK